MSSVKSSRSGGDGGALGPMSSADSIAGPDVVTARTVSGLIFNIQRHSTEDGPGIRTTVFLKGCPMRCPWCHNPEGIEPRPQLVWYSVRCVGARKCVEVCPKGALALTKEGIVIDRRLCDACGDCVDRCPSLALEVIGKRYGVNEVAEVALRDKVFYETSGGGVTLSGGEPGLQSTFSQAVMRALKREGVHVALDTCGGISWRRIEPLVQLADLVLYDLKIFDEELHLRYTAVPLELVLDNARRVAASGKPIWIRTPVIPGYTDSSENIRKIARFIRDNLQTVERYDLLAFNNTCSAKYGRLNSRYALSDEALVPEQKMEELAAAARDEGVACVRWSGMTRRQAEAPVADSPQ
jgi:pyruvate formate lyase activating enzyme